MKIAETALVEGVIKLVERDMTAEEEAEFAALQDDEPTQETDALKEMITAMSTASTLAQMRNAAKEFLNKTGGNSND